MANASLGQPLTFDPTVLFEEARLGKGGEPIREMPLGSHQEYRFTFLSIWAHTQRASFKTIDAQPEIPFGNIYWTSPYPEVYIRFAGLRKEIVEGWVVKFNKPPWKVALNPPVRLFPTWSPEGKALIAEREKLRKAANADYKVTVYSKNGHVGWGSIGSSQDETKKQVN